MLPKIKTFRSTKLLGHSLKMTLAENRTSELWRQFSPRIPEIKDRSSKNRISMQLYPPMFYQNFSVDTVFEKWAAVPVHHFENVPNNMKIYVIEQGLYAVFDYKGPANDHGIFSYIFNEWLPNSAYLLDLRPHFEILGQTYSNHDPNSEEQIWIPIKNK